MQLYEGGHPHNTHSRKATLAAGQTTSILQTDYTGLQHPPVRITWRRFSLIANQLEISDPPRCYYWRLTDPGSKPHKGDSITRPSRYGTLCH